MKPILNLPNQITIARLGLAIVFFVLLSQYAQRTPNPWMLVVAAVIFIVAAVSDILDGYVARKRGQVTSLGKVLDPLVDKFLVCGAFIMFVGPGFVDQDGRNVTEVHSWMVVLIVGRELLATGLRGSDVTNGKVLGATIHGKLKMWMQSIAVPAILLIIAGETTGSMGATAGWIKAILVWLTVAVTALTMLLFLIRPRYPLKKSAPA